jgi:hypothetical protein
MERFSCAVCPFNATAAGVCPMDNPDEIWCSYGYEAVNVVELEPAQDSDLCAYDPSTWQERVAEIQEAIRIRKASRCAEEAP